MNVSSDNSFNLSNFVSREKGDQKLADPQIQQIGSSYQKLLQDKLADQNLQKLLYNKSITALFLDKVPTTSGQTHPDAELVRRFGFSSSTFNSMQIMRYLQKIRDNPRLTPETRTAIDKWVQTEKEYLDIAIIFDGWRLANPNTMKILQAGTQQPGVMQLMGFGKPSMKVAPPENEVNALAQALADHIRAMKPGDTFKMLGGYDIHETRLLIKKMPDDKVYLYHYNTAYMKTVEKFGMKEEAINTPEFWRKFILTKLQTDSIDGMMRLLSSLGWKENLEDADKLTPRQMQQSDACPAQAIEADLKHQLVWSHADPNEGLIQYKIVKSAMAECALEERGRINPEVAGLLESKERVKHRYLHWADTVDNPEKFEELKNLYVTMIHMLESAPWVDQSINRSLEASRAICLRELDKTLNSCLKSAHKDKVEAAIQKHDEIWPRESPILCLKHFQRTQKVKEVIAATHASASSWSGQTLGLLRRSLVWLPPRLAYKIQPFLQIGQLEPADMLKFIREYTFYESPSTSLPVVRKLLETRLLNLDDIMSLLQSHKSEGNGEIIKGLAQIILDTPDITTETKNFGYAALDPTKIDSAAIKINDLATLLTLLNTMGYSKGALSLLAHQMRKGDVDYNYLDTYANTCGFESKDAIKLFADVIKTNNNREVNRKILENTLTQLYGIYSREYPLIQEYMIAVGGRNVAEEVSPEVFNRINEGTITKLYAQGFLSS